MIYDDKPVLRAIVEALGAELDELNEAVTNLNKKRWLATAEGKQLDGIGEIIDRNRTIEKAIALSFFGFAGQLNTVGFEEARFRDFGENILENYLLEDAEYRILLRMKAAKNVSRTTTEDTIASLRYVFNAPIVIVTEVGNANLDIAIGKKLTANEIILANATNLLTRAGGVGIRRRLSFNYNHYMGFLGQQNARGFEVGSFADFF